MMKKTTFGILAVAAVCLFAACTEKEGIYNPKKKIANVYQSSMSVYKWYDEMNDQWVADTSMEAKTLTETWTWEGKKLAKITFYEHSNVTEKEGANVDDVVSFTYDGKQVVRAEGEDEYMTFSYDGKELKRAEMYDKSGSTATPMVSFDFEHKDGKIVKIDVTGEGGFLDKSSAVRLERVMMRGLLPDCNNAEKAVSAIHNSLRKSGAKAQITIPFALTWEGDNISEMSTKISVMGITVPISIKYSYDNKNNPYQNFLFGMIDMMEEGGMLPFNKNNITKSVMSESFMGETREQEVNYTYTYEGDWPTSQTVIEISDNEDEDHSESTVINYFEYQK